jgi:peptide chain release factor
MKKLLFSLTKDDFDFQAIRAGGPGGQHQNKTSSAIRVIHSPSGASAISREHKSQLQNKKSAFTKLVNNDKFKL